MSTRKDLSQENADGQYPKGWLNLSLGEYLGASNSPASRPIKVHKCNFCKRMFYSSQALGGHQNAHKKERDAVKRYLSPNSEMNFMVQPHSLANTVIGSFADDGATWVQPCDQEKAVGSNWPGYIHHVEAQTASQLSDQHMLDLNLKL